LHLEITALPEHQAEAVQRLHFANNVVRIRMLGYIGKYNRCVKNSFKILNRLWKKCQKTAGRRGGGDFFLTHTVVQYVDRYCAKGLILMCIWRCSVDVLMCFILIMCGSFIWTVSG